MKKICFLVFAVLSCVSIFAQTDGQSIAEQSEPDEIAAIVLAQNGHSPAYGMSFIAKAHSRHGRCCRGGRDSIPW
jgi:hypothetical protein